MLHGGSGQNGWRRLIRRHPDVAVRFEPVLTYHTSSQAFIARPRSAQRAWRRCGKRSRAPPASSERRELPRVELRIKGLSGAGPPGSYKISDER